MSHQPAYLVMPVQPRKGAGQKGGIAPALPIVLGSLHKIGTTVKPATKAKEALNKTKFGKTTAGKILSGILSAGQLLGYGEEVPVKGGKKKGSGKKGGAKKVSRKKK